jgi:hypothetical protein
MPFSSYKSMSTAIKEFQLTYTETNFVIGTPFDLSDYFREDLQTVMREGVVDNSEFAICENLIYPVLKEVWKPYSKKFTLWSHQSLVCDDNLTGFPEYILAKRSPLGKIVFDQPYFLLVEAKQDKFDEGWGQCLAEMVTAQRLNQTSIPVFGIVSNGSSWQFGKLTDQSFTKHIPPYSIYELDALFSAVHYVFQQCDLVLENLVPA